MYTYVCHETLICHWTSSWSDILSLFNTLFYLYRSNLSQFLLEGGQSQSWLLGNKIITITTSGGAKVNDSGLCEKCFKTAKLVSDKQKRQVKDNQSESIAPAVKGRKRHRSAAVPRSSETVKPLKVNCIVTHDFMYKY